jgi:hypothetical protein
MSVQISFSRTEAPLTRAPDVRALLHRLADEYPERWRAAQHADVATIAFYLSIVIREGDRAHRVRPGRRRRAVLRRCRGPRLHRKHGIRVLSKDVLTDDLGLEPGSLDAVTPFDSMEHWHHSPRRPFTGCLSP